MNNSRKKAQETTYNKNLSRLLMEIIASNAKSDTKTDTLPAVLVARILNMSVVDVRMMSPIKILGTDFNVI